ncbi:LCP family protein [Tomitella fengzijianii]|uniref:LytR family transcriptional regulator n=1 Tax=Tomitella fengzijianii TaxID=2597660 RepID=A0A516X0Q9_9ACTN|nr:LCP family protein [Tomitella fengzijianii]QDQ96674.1 LytR family transcriptional regulator [Tomitella fengzijianii]
MAGRPRSRRPLSRRGRVLRALARAALAIVLILVMLGGAALVLQDRWIGPVHRIPDAFAGLDESVRPPDTGGSETVFLLMGSDVRADGPTTGTAAPDSDDGSRADAIMLVRISGDGSSADVVSIPRDSWVPIDGHGMHKINAAFAFGGPPLLIHTVEELTGIRIDHFAVIDFDGFTAVTDALGGVTVDVAEQTTSRGHTFTAGPNHLDGAEALIYVRQRYELPGGDFDRVQRQQNYLRAVLTKLAGENLLASPGRLDTVIRDIAGSVSVDSGLSDFDLIRLARRLQNLSPDDVEFLTAPVAGTGWEGDQSVVYLNRQGGEEVWAALRAGQRPPRDAGADRLPAVPR